MFLVKNFVVILLILLTFVGCSHAEKVEGRYLELNHYLDQILVEGLIEDLDSHWDPGLQCQAACTLGYMGYRAEKAVPALVNTLGLTNDSELKIWCAFALGSIGGPDAKMAVPSLVRRQKSLNPYVSIECARALYRINRAQTALEELEFHVRHPDERVRKMTARFLGEIGSGARRLVPVLVRGLEDNLYESEDTREVMKEAIKKIDPDYPL